MASWLAVLLAAVVCSCQGLIPVDPYRLSPEMEEDADPADAVPLFTSFTETERAVLQHQPVVLIPGFGGSGLEATMSRSEIPFPFCPKETKGYVREWIDVHRMQAPFSRPCWVDEMALRFNEQSFERPTGVDMRPIDWGGVSGIDFLDHNQKYMLQTNYFGTLIKNLEALGYKTGKDLVGAPYDWRLPPSALEREGWFDKLRLLMEKTSNENDGKPVAVLSHGTGGNLMIKFLQTQKQEWLDQYVDSFIALSTPFLGAPKALRALVTGDKLGLPDSMSSRLEGRQLSRRFGSMPWMLPTVEGWKDTPIMTVVKEDGAHKYMAEDLERVLENVGAQTAAAVYQHVKHDAPLDKPQVKMFCFYGTGKDTEVQYLYKDHRFDEMPELETERAGDGYSPYRSLSWCRSHWPSQEFKMNQGHKGAAADQVEYKEYNGRDHSGVMHDKEVIQDIMTILTQWQWQ